MATNMLSDYYCFPKCTTVLISSTTRESLENRVWGEMKKYHRMARARFPELPGNLIEGKQRIITDNRMVTAEGRDFRNGICFPAGTLVDTPSGPKAIETIEEYDLVINAIGSGLVKRIYRQIAPELVRVRLSDGRTIDCTPEHPFLTNRGWIKAVALKTFDRVFSAHETVRIMQSTFGKRLSKSEILLCNLPRSLAANGLRVLRNNISSLQTKDDTSKSSVLQYELLKFMGIGEWSSPSFCESKMRSLRQAHEASSSQSTFLFGSLSKSNEACQMPRMQKDLSINKAFQKAENFFLQCLLQMEMEQPSYWPEKQNSYQTGTSVGFPISQSNSSSRSLYREKIREKYSSQIYNGFGLSTRNVGCGNRRWDSSNPKQTGERCKTDERIEFTWVEGIEILKQAGDARYSERDFGYPVFNLEVEGHPSYSVNGVIVHNCGVPCKKGQNYQGLSEYAGIKNSRMRLGADELHFLPADFISAIANLNKNPDFKCVGLGNPKDITDALGKLCEPSAEKGGWDAGIDQQPGTKTWPIRFENGICIQLMGSDSPNLDGKLGIPLISQKEIDEDIRFYGRDSLQFTMMDEGMMPRGQASKRVITRQLCQKFGAMEEPVWKDDKQTKVTFLDAAYGGVGGDRCVYGELWFGKGTEDKQILWLKETMVVPVSALKPETPEDQIALFVKEQNEERGVAPNHFFFDSTGRGSLMNALGRLYSNTVGGVEFGGKATERPVSEMIDVQCCDYYFNFVTELWFSSRLIIEGGQFRGMTEDVMQEGSMREWGKVANNKIQVEPKDKMKIKTSRSPDLYDALCAGIEGARRLGFVISKLASVGNHNFNDEWKKDLRERRDKFKARHALNHSA